jgi:methionine-rich copper-binding protein CopC
VAKVSATRPGVRLGAHPARLVRLLLALGLAACTVFAAALPSVAHAGLSGSNPLDGEALAARPEVVELKFTQDVLAGYTTLALTTGNGGSIPLPAAREAGPVVTQPVPLLASGKYTLTYRIVSPDGHPIAGRIKFSVEVPGETIGNGGVVGQAPAQAATTSQPSQDDGDGSASWWIAVAAGVGALIVIVAVLQRRVHRRTPAEDAGV